MRRVRPPSVRQAWDAVEFRVPWRRGLLARRYAIDYETRISGALADLDVSTEFASLDRLPPQWGVGMPERIVEFPWIVAKLRAEPSGLTLDAGSTLNHGYVLDHVLPAVSALHVVTLAPERESFPERGISYLYADLRELPLRSSLYDTVVCLSTLEHVGMDVSGYHADAAIEIDPQRAAVRAARELRRVVKPEGRILASVPFGRPDNLGWVRQFDRSSLRELTAAFGPGATEITVYRYQDDGWQISTMHDAADCPSQPYWATAVACIEVRPRGADDSGP